MTTNLLTMTKTITTATTELLLCTTRTTPEPPAATLLLLSPLLLLPLLLLLLVLVLVPLYDMCSYPYDSYCYVNRFLNWQYSQALASSRDMQVGKGRQAMYVCAARSCECSFLYLS